LSQRYARCSAGLVPFVGNFAGNAAMQQSDSYWFASCLKAFNGRFTIEALG
jgi:hypothetical protein